MTVSKIISSGVDGAEAAALDVAIRLKIPYDGYAGPHAMGQRYRLREMTFNKERALDEANLHLADATLIFTRGSLVNRLAHIDRHAQSRVHPCFHADLDLTDPLQAAFHIRIWTDKHAPRALFVTGSREAETGPGFYQAVYDTLFSFLMLGKTTYSEPEPAASANKQPPRSVAEAVERLMVVLPLKDRVTIANMSAGEIGDLNATLGNYIRNAFGLWAGNRALLWSCSREAGRKVDTAEDASAVILARLASGLEKTHKLRKI